jgi:hypothetical protein
MAAGLTMTGSMMAIIMAAASTMVGDPSISGMRLIGRGEVTMDGVTVSIDSDRS